MPFGAIIRLIVAVVFLTAAFAYLSAYRNEMFSMFRSMRVSAVVICFSWTIWLTYTGWGVGHGWEFPFFVRDGSFEVALLFPTAAYLLASAWVTRKVVRSWG